MIKSFDIKPCLFSPKKILILRKLLPLDILLEEANQNEPTAKKFTGINDQHFMDEV